ncbi:MAG: response regulator [Flavisolibacter sp.]
MNKDGPIIVIEDDRDDQEILIDVFKSLKFVNEIIFYQDGIKALEYLNKAHTKPFLILSDVNMPKMDGFELRKRIQTNEELAIKCIPFLFFTTGKNKKFVVDAYTLSVQGYFQKPNSMAELEEVLSIIVRYWQKCSAPSEY